MLRLRRRRLLIPPLPSYSRAFCARQPDPPFAQMPLASCPNARPVCDAILPGFSARRAPHRNPGRAGSRTEVHVQDAGSALALGLAGRPQTLRSLACPRGSSGVKCGRRSRHGSAQILNVSPPSFPAAQAGSCPRLLSADQACQTLTFHLLQSGGWSPTPALLAARIATDRRCADSGVGRPAAARFACEVVAAISRPPAAPQSALAFER